MNSSDDEVTIKEESAEEILQWEESQHRSAFSSFKVLTNLQRGNIETQTHRLPNTNFHIKAGMGELSEDHFTQDTDVNALERNLTPLMWAASYGQIPTARLLISKGCEVDCKNDDGNTALFFASSSGHHEIIRLLIQSGANPNFIDDVGNTPLMYAAYSDSPHCVSELLENGADITLTNMENQTAYRISMIKGCKQAQAVIEKFLLRLIESS